MLSYNYRIQKLGGQLSGVGFSEANFSKLEESGQDGVLALVIDFPSRNSDACPLCVKALFDLLLEEYLSNDDKLPKEAFTLALKSALAKMTFLAKDLGGYNLIAVLFSKNEVYFERIGDPGIFLVNGSRKLSLVSGSSLCDKDLVLIGTPELVKKYLPKNAWQGLSELEKDLKSDKDLSLMCALVVEFSSSETVAVSSKGNCIKNFLKRIFKKVSRLQ